MPCAVIEQRSGESACGCHTHYRWLRLANIPRRRANGSGPGKQKRRAGVSRSAVCAKPLVEEKG